MASSAVAPDLWAALDGVHDRQEAKYAATCEAVRGHLTTLSKLIRIDGIVTSDDGVEYLNKHGITADKRLLGAVFRSGFVRIGYAKSRYRRGMHATWKAV